ncbi:uncharacterized protein LOC104581284 [Brachypodium distachyon]|uniref:Myb/SANT-like domain-containing protein n=1 Tax=Brachypodium distachyon TaxID=15368 RepID=A0A0Q3I4P9_BRADI|nr:uncharacterized protein LOC104581284 [Brachypodium distachyon]KQK00827.1 hypothetical protein BRADI_3g52075v3 [Brachypodium distachyon]|eukprot:XP_024318020.1 uncharacterized protein LOC104581284 [Brachypodium distachyon]
MDGEVVVVAEGRGGTVTWTSVMTTFMLKHMTAHVETGARTSAGFKSMHYNGCARALNDHFKQSLYGHQISNHYRTVKKKFVKIKNIKDEGSGAGWDDATSTLRMDHDMALKYIDKHKWSAEYIDKPIENYYEMQTCFGDRLATVKYAKGSSEPLGTATTPLEVDEEEDVLGPQSNIGSSATKSLKRAKKEEGEEESLISTLRGVGTDLANAIAKAGANGNDIPDGLYETLCGLEGYNEDHVAQYYGFLVDHPKKARGFMTQRAVELDGSVHQEGVH